MKKGMDCLVALETGFWFIDVHPPKSATSISTKKEQQPRATNQYGASGVNIIQAVV